MYINKKLDVAVIGAGFAGIGAGIKLKQEGIESFKIFERSNDVGGTWRDNNYPGCACDIPSNLYSYSFEPNPEWSRAFSPHNEIHDYLKHCVKKYKITEHIQFSTEIQKVFFDVPNGHWVITDTNEKIYLARTIISASGPLNQPLYPKIKGINSFKGESFHSLYWNHSYDLKGKKIAIIGTGASAIQFIPEVAKEAAKLTIFQRTAPWIERKFDKENSEKTKKRFRRFPIYQKFWRELIYWFLEKRGKSQYEPNEIREKRRTSALKYLEKSISDPELRKKLTPDYEIGCKRVLLSSNYYPTLNKENVELVTDAISEITENGIIDQSGKLHKVDVIIYGTGFYTTTYKHLYEVKGINRQSLFDKWSSEGGEAYYGMTVNGFPNFVLMVGPNTGLGHNSIVHMMESQLNYIMGYLKYLDNNPNSALNVKETVQNEFNDKIQQQLKTMIWSDGGCNSYYLKDSDGKNTSIWPGSTMSYRKQTKRINMSDYNLVPTKPANKELS
jgi:cation diffusion facilitator CzcD-associated flavoprotein CzcO